MRHEPVLRAFGFDLFHRLTERERLALRKNIGEQHVVMPAERVQRLCKGNEVAGNQARTLVNELIERVLAVGAGLAPIDGPGWAVDMLTFKRDMFPVAFHGQLLKVSGETLQILFVRQHCNGFRSKEIGVPDSEQAKQNGQIALKRSSAEVLVHLMEAAQHGTEILGADGQYGGKADGGVHRIAPANPVPEAEHVFSVDAEFGNLRGVRGNGDEMFRNRLFIAAETFERPFARGVGVGHGLKGSERFRGNDKERFGRIEIDNGFGKVCAVDVGDETEGHAAFAVMLQRLVRHYRTEVRAADTNVDDIADALTCVAGPGTAADAVREGAHSVEDSMDLGNHIFPVDNDGRFFWGAQGYVQYGAIFGDVDFVPPKHRSDTFAEPRLFRQFKEQPDGFLSDAILGIVERNADGFGRKLLCSFRIIVK